MSRHLTFTFRTFSRRFYPKRLKITFGGIHRVSNRRIKPLFPSEKLPSVPDLRLVLLGSRKAGKTSCGDTILGRAGCHADDLVVAGTERHAHVRGVAVTVVDPPPRPPSSRDHEREVTCGLSALLLVVNASSSFTSSLLEALEEQVSGGAEEKQMVRGAEEKEEEEQMLGGAEEKEEKEEEDKDEEMVGGAEETGEEEEKQIVGGAEEKEKEEEEEKEDKEMRWSRAMVLFSHGDWLGDTSIEERIESEDEALRSLVERCGNRYHVLDNRHRGDGAQVHRLLDQVEEMLLGARQTLLRRGGDPIRRSVTLAGRHSKQGLAVGQRHRKIQDGACERNTR